VIIDVNFQFIVSSWCIANLAASTQVMA